MIRKQWICFILFTILFVVSVALVGFDRFVTGYLAGIIVTLLVSAR